MLATRSKSLVFAPLAAAALLFSGCASVTPIVPAVPVPTPSATAPPTVAPQPDLDVATVTIDGRGISLITAKGTVVNEILFTEDAQLAITALADAVETEPVLRDIPPAAPCTLAASTARWGEELWLTYGTAGLPEGQQFNVTARAAAAGSVSLTTPAGIAVGDSLETITDAYPDARTLRYDSADSSYAQFDYDVVEGFPASADTLPADYWGAKAWTEDGVVTAISGPVHLEDWC
jgi:hypothetical protein